jgi:membrane protease YdiL (CAAX protease family)
MPRPTVADGRRSARAGAATEAAAVAIAALAAVVAFGGWPGLCGPSLHDAAPARVLWAMLVAPLLEECALRPGLHDALLDAGVGRGGALLPGPANLLVATAFAAAHAGVAGWPLLAAYLLPAWWIGLAWERTRRLAPCVAIHAAANAAALVACGRA